MIRHRPFRLPCGLTVLFLVLAGRAAALNRSWHLATEYMDGQAYAVATMTVTGERVALTVAKQSSYTKDPTAGALSFWSNDLTHMERLCYAISNHAVVVVGDWVYVMGGCQKDTGGCGASGTSRTVATVWFHHIEPNGDLTPTGFLCPNTNWQQANYELGAFATGVGQGIKMRSHRAVAVGNRIYVVGGDTTACGGAGIPGAKPSTTDVYSAVVDPVTGQTGPWRVELPLRSSAAKHGLVYAGGALFCLGGMAANGSTPQLIVQRADINPQDGRLYSEGNLFWDPALSLPTGPVPLSCPPPAPTGWVWISPFSVMRTIGFIGGAYADFPFGSCQLYRGTFHGILDDCNVIQEWIPRDNGSGGLFGSGVVAYNGSLLQAGGSLPGGSSSPQVHFNLIDASTGAGRPGLVREGSGDLEELRSGDPDGVELFTGSPPTSYNLIKPITHLNIVRHNEFAYIVGGDMTGTPDPCYEVHRTLLAATTWWVDAGSYLSPAYDLNGTFQLSRVAWSFTKAGSATHDDWAMVRYRVASPAGKWTCWSPRVPDIASMPSGPGYYTYASDAQSVLYREPLMPDTFRYIQFEVSLYNDPSNDAGTTPFIPSFDDFSISYGPVTPPKPISCPLEVYPNPARDTVTVRFEVAQEGGEVSVRVYNAAAHLAAQDSFRYLKGGVKEETLTITGYAPGAYVVIVEGLAQGGGPGLTCLKTGEVLKSAKAKFVVRR